MRATPISGFSRGAVTLPWLVVLLLAACAAPTYSRTSVDGGQGGTGGIAEERDSGTDRTGNERVDASGSGAGDGASATGGAGASAGTAGTVTGGAPGAGAGMTGGGAATGGAMQGGSGAGSQGGRATGGQVTSTGGQSTGGRATGGLATGGSGAGGSSTGGQALAGSPGQASGGAAGAGGMGGQGLGGATGGASTGGAPGPLIISVDFVGGAAAAAGADGGAMPPSMDPSEMAGYKPAAYWNAASDFMGTLSGLKTCTGQSTGAKVDWNSPPSGVNPGIWTVGYADAPGDVRMMNGYLDPSAVASPATVSVTSLPAAIAAKPYDVYVYVWGGIPSSATRVYRYSLGNASVDVSQTGPTSTTFTGYQLVSTSGGGGNVVVFKNVTGAAFTLTATPVSGTQLRAPVNGLQIVSPAGS